jgi:hypothetical protein
MRVCHIANAGFDLHQSHFLRLRRSRLSVDSVGMDSSAQRAIELKSSQLLQVWGTNGLGGHLCKDYREISPYVFLIFPLQHYYPSSHYCPWIYYHFSHPYGYYVLSFNSLLVDGYHSGWLTIALSVHLLTEWDWNTQMRMVLLQTGLKKTLLTGSSPSPRTLHWRNLQFHQHEV